MFELNENRRVGGTGDHENGKVAMEARKPTMRDVAERAGVSVGTASAVFTDKPTVSERARVAVLAAANEVGYRPTRRRRVAATGIMTIGLVSQMFGSSGSTNRSDYPFYGPILNGAEKACAELGVSLVFEVLRRTSDSLPGELPMTLRRKQAQGLLLLGYLDPAYVAEIVRTDVPCVLVNNVAPEVPVDSVCNDDAQGGSLATRHLLQLGHAHPAPAVIAGPQRLPSMRRRLEGYFQALRDWGVEADPAYVRIAPGMDGKDGRAEMAALLDLPVPPTAVACCNDFTALGAMELLRELDVKVPQECSVIGYEDLHVASHAVPPLSTIAVDQELLGMQGVWHLVERVRHPHIAIRENRLAVRLVERGSTSQLNADTGGAARGQG